MLNLSDPKAVGWCVEKDVVRLARRELPVHEYTKGETVVRLRQVVRMLQSVLVWEICQYLAVDDSTPASDDAVPEDLLCSLQASDSWVPLDPALIKRLERARSKTEGADDFVPEGVPPAQGKVYKF